MGVPPDAALIQRAEWDPTTVAQAVAAAKAKLAGGGKSSSGGNSTSGGGGSNGGNGWTEDENEEEDLIEGEQKDGSATGSYDEYYQAMVEYLIDNRKKN